MVTCACCGLEKPNTVALNCHPEIALCRDCLDRLARRLDAQEVNAGSVRIVNDDPVFLVADVARALDHYTKLGFSTDTHDDTYAFADATN